jgi:DNA-binding MarR family transcriptional regulator
LTAWDANLRADSLDRLAAQASRGSDSILDEICRRAIAGRLAVRFIGKWTERFQLTEPEFQILWCVQVWSGAGLDQTALAARLAFSPAQVSSCVEKLRARGLLSPQEMSGDRRRRVWRVSSSGFDLLQRVFVAASECLACSPPPIAQRENAA